MESFQSGILHISLSIELSQVNASDEMVIPSMLGLLGYIRFDDKKNASAHDISMNAQ